MSGMEVVALIAAIVGAYSGTAAFLIARKKRKEDKARRAIEERERLNNAVTLAPRQIQNEYDQDFARIGQRFAVGDEITRSQLSDILITMQGDMIQRLQKMVLSNRSNETVDYVSLLSISDVSRQKSITALAQQYQRLSVAAPIAASIPAASLSAPTSRRPNRMPSPFTGISRNGRDPVKSEPLSAWDILVPGTGSTGKRPCPFWQCTGCGLRTYFSGLRRHWIDTRDWHDEIWLPSPKQEMRIRTKQPFMNSSGKILKCKCRSARLSMVYEGITKKLFAALEISLIADGLLFRCNGLGRSSCGDPQFHEPHVYGPYFTP